LVWKPRRAERTSVNSGDVLELPLKPDVEGVCRYAEFAGQPGKIFAFVVDEELVAAR
jgi:hypothetical protein